MKKILTIALVLCMMLSICVVSVGAADGNRVELQLGNVSVDPSGTVTVDLNIVSNSGDGFAMAAINFNYDETVLTLQKITNHTEFGMMPNLTKPTEQYDARVSVDHYENYTGEGEFLTLTFLAADTAVPGLYEIEVTVTQILAFDESYNAVAVENCSVDSGSVTVKATNPVKSFNVALGENFALNFPYKATANDVITVTNAAGEPVEYVVEDGVITIPNIVAKDLDEAYTVTVNGWETTASVIDYCEYQKENSEDPYLIALMEAMQVYNAAAENYFEDAAHELTVDTCDVGTDNPRVVENAATGATFYSVRLQLDDGVKVLARMKNYTNETITVTIDGVASAYEVKDVEGMMTVFVPVKAHQYDADIVITVGDSTLTYSVNTYIQQKQTSSNADLANLVNALGNYGKAAEAYAASVAA